MKKANTEGHILHDPICIECPEEANPWRQEADEWLPGAVDQGETGRACFIGMEFPLGTMKYFAVRQW